MDIAETIQESAFQRANASWLPQPLLKVNKKSKYCFILIFTKNYLDCADNESLMCSNGCPEQTCTPNKAKCLGPPIRPDCKKTCQCSAGYVRHQGACVLQSKCPGTQSCGTNEVFTSCKNACNSCDVLTGRHPCDPLPPPYCGSGCDCKPGFRRLSDKCVAPEECPQPNLVEMMTM